MDIPFADITDDELTDWANSGSYRTRALVSALRDERSKTRRWERCFQDLVTVVPEVMAVVTEHNIISHLPSHGVR